MTNPAIIVIGASSAIARAFVKTQVEQNSDVRVITVSRQAKAASKASALHFQCDYSEAQIQKVGRQIFELDCTVKSVTIFNGLLHDEFDKFPEKKLEDVDLGYSMALFNINTMIPMLWLQALLPTIKGKQSCVVTALSARVGSISDNRMGGWYSYRSSKAALNMMFKSAAVELARRAKNIKLILFHPGTTDTPLSKPFQANVPDEKLFTPEFVADQLSSIIAKSHPDGTVSYVDWQNKSIEW
ncbi:MULTISPECIES: SDR family NAD(P)-dependent oxidoreductase [Pseudoalteromonas]|uniref:SDR family NAD(P)-dependent oxidoreductase n=1 Tax=Pseudoalteromonas TaxID=53246 RepID=UPI000FFEBBB8|nr:MULTISPECIES: SDR family NAD(P)-dependent oxidoreductase [Pseudoalteromonas]MCG9761465.1 SDR family NAD(P)-dependent oxidoreductase [Pseudoalteromonas sp. Isolate6]NKC20730.1 SDR family NAD(P)-dependent oxidoreductase [Pseudoalteromonas galatheae]RXE87079.1 short-chain dehydrogenase [Pseudoalteromonas sp. A757]